MVCIYCSSSNFVRNGHDKKWVQRFKRNDCHRMFCEKGIFARMKFPVEVIRNALFLRPYHLSTRNVERILIKLSYIKVSHVTIFNWIIKSAPHMCKFASIFPITFFKVWHVDEKFIKVRKSKDKFAYLWVVSDDRNNVIATYVSFGRDCKNAKIVLQKAKHRAGFSPKILVSDGLQSYKKSCKKVFGRETRHIIAHF